MTAAVRPATAAPRASPPVPLFASTAVAVATPAKQSRSGPAAVTPAATATAALAGSSEGGCDDSEAGDEFDGGDFFAVDSVSIQSILDDDAWKDEADDDAGAAPMPSAFASALGGGASASSMPPPVTPRRTTLGCAPVRSLLTPRSANRGSIYGGALRTPVSRESHMAPRGSCILHRSCAHASAAVSAFAMEETRADCADCALLSLCDRFSSDWLQNRARAPGQQSALRTPASRLTVSGTLPNLASAALEASKRAVMPSPSPAAIRLKQSQDAIALVSSLRHLRASWGRGDALCFAPDVPRFSFFVVLLVWDGCACRSVGV